MFIFVRSNGRSNKYPYRFHPYRPPTGSRLMFFLCVCVFVLQLHKESPLGFKKLEWFKAGRTLAEVPELFGSQAANDAAYYRTAKAAAGAGVRQSKKARIEVTDDEDYLIVPDLG